MNASSTLMRCLADVSINLQPKCFARSLPSVDVDDTHQLANLWLAPGGDKGKLTVFANLTFVLEIHLVCNKNHREGLSILDTQNALMEGSDFLERVARGNAIDEQETLA